MNKMAAAGVTVVGEGDMDVAAVGRIITECGLAIARGFPTRGKGPLDAKLEGYNNAAQRSAWFCLRDSDTDAGDCPAALVRQLLPNPAPGMCLRLAVRSLEAWLLADPAFSTMLRIRDVADPDALPDAKRALVQLCAASRSSRVKEQMVPRPGTGSSVGPEYTSVLLGFITTTWDIAEAATRSSSLARALAAVDSLVSSGIW